VAAVVIEGDELVVRLTALERSESLHRDVRVPAASVRVAEPVDDPVRLVRGLKLPGARLPGVFAVGTFVEHGRRCFAVVHHGAARGVRIELEGADYDELVVGCDDPEAVVAAVRAGRR
jgi:hypothetical protein